MLSTDREKGKVLLILASVIFIYYTVWLIGLPFVDDSRLKSLFYSHNIALLVPAVGLFCFIGGLVLFTYYHIRPYMKNTPREKQE